MGQQTSTVRHRWRISVTHDIRTSGVSASRQRTTLCRLLQYIPQGYNLPHTTRYTCMVALRIQWNLSMKGNLNEGHLSIKDTACCPNYTHRAVYKPPLI